MSGRVVLLAGVIAGLAGSGAHHLVFPARWLQCDVDVECIRVAAGCCGCENGGRSIAINARYQDRYDRRWESLLCVNRCPEEFLCPADALTFCNANHRCQFGVP